MDTLHGNTFTFLFTDIEGSTKLWEQYPEGMRDALARHDALLEQIITAHGGHVFKTVGDAFCAAFARPSDALDAALDTQEAMQAEPWGELETLRVRVALHTGAAQERGNDYFGPALNRVARLLSAGHGSQTLLSQSTYEAVRSHLPPSLELRDMGERRLKDLTRPEHIYQVVVSGLPSEFPPLKTLDYRPNNLPRQTTAFIGRDKEIGELRAMLRHKNTSLVTVTGPGGMGKTRLSLQVSADLLDDFADGVWFVELAALMEHRLVAPTIANVLGIKETGDEPILDVLKSNLRDKQMLLVLDNFEQVVAASPQVVELLAACPDLRLLVTSREVLRVRGEKEFPAPPLSLPDVSRHDRPTLERLEQYEATRLFIERATEIKPNFEVTDSNAPEIAEICARLDGLPLAIELAAARVRVFSTQALLKRLSGRLGLLTGGARDLPARQQTLRNTIEWSYDLLSAGEKQLFARMSVFQGGRTLQALEAVCNCDGYLQLNVLEGVESLVSKSLLQQREGRDGEEGEPRFWMLETIHEYAREKLEESGEASALEKEHALYFMAFAEEAEPYLTGPKQGEWLSRLEDDHDNFRAALHWASDSVLEAQQGRGGHRDEQASTVLEIGLRIAGALHRFWTVRGYASEGREQLARMLSLRPQPTPSPSGAKLDQNEVYAANALAGAGRLAWSQGDYSTAQSLLDESLNIFRELGEKAGMAKALSNIGLVAWNRGDYDTARSLHSESLALRRELGDKWGVAASLNNLAILQHELGDYAGARPLYEECLAIYREVGDNWTIATVLNNLADAAGESGDREAARSLHEESLALRRELGDKWGMGSSLGNVADILRELGDYEGAHSYFEESLKLRRELGDKMSVAWCLEGLASVERLQGKEGRATELWGAAEALREAIGAPLPHSRVPFHNEEVSALRAQMGAEALERALSEGRSMSMEQAIEYALKETPPPPNP